MNKFVSERIAAGATSAINVVAVYANAEAGKRAIEAYDRLVQRFGKKVDLNCDFWNFSTTRHPAMQSQAGAQSAPACVVLVAPDASNQVPPHVEDWIKNCTEQALVAKVKSHPSLRRSQAARRSPSLMDLFLERSAGPDLVLAA